MIVVEIAKITKNGKDSQRYSTLYRLYAARQISRHGGTPPVMQDNDAANTIPGNGDMSVQSRNQHYYLQRSAQIAGTEAERSHLRQRILLVEDDISLAALEADILTAHGYTVVIVDSGELALAKIRAFVPDLVILDLELTGTLNGLDVLRAMRTHTAVPVLFTTSATPEARKITRRSGESRLTLDHLAKPYSMPILLKRVQRLLMIASH